MLLTFRDAIDNLVDYTGGDVKDVELRVFRRAVRQAYTMFYSLYPWRYYMAAANIGLSNNTLSARMKFTESTKVLSREFTVLTATATSPIRITAESDGNLTDGETITIRNATGDTGLNGTWVVSQFSSTEFDLVGSTTAGTYDAGSGSFNRGTFPDWAGDATAKIGNTRYQTVEKIDNYNLLLGETHYPRQDTAGDYTLTVRHYDLPADFLKMSHVTDGSLNYASECYVSPEEWLTNEQHGFWNSTIPFQWTILPHPKLKQRYRLHFNGNPATDRNISFVYQRRLNDAFRWAGVEADSSSIDDAAKTISVTNGSVTVNGSGTNFRNSMVGAVLRVGVAQSSTDPDEPTGLDGVNPYEEEHVIKTVNSVTQITLETAITGSTASGLQFMITDLIDIAPSHINLFYRLCEHQYNIISRDQSKLHASEASWQAAARLAMENEHFVNFYGSAMGSRVVLGLGDPNNTDFGDTVSVGP